MRFIPSSLTLFQKVRSAQSCWIIALPTESYKITVLRLVVNAVHSVSEENLMSIRGAQDQQLMPPYLSLMIPTVHQSRNQVLPSLPASRAELGTVLH